MAEPTRLTIVTGASANHEAPLHNLLRSIEMCRPGARVVVYDLGLTPQGRAALPSWAERRHFDFAAYPTHVDISVNAGQYAWKPIILAGHLNEDGYVLWLDAGDLVRDDLRLVRFILGRSGVYTPTSHSNVQRWTHPATLRYLNAPSHMLTWRNRNTAVVGFDPRRPEVRRLIECWRDCALNPDCIAPPGSDRSNHRQDQAVLTVLAYKHQAQHRIWLTRCDFEVTIHNDRLTPAQAEAQVRMKRRRSFQIVKLAFCYALRL